MADPKKDETMNKFKKGQTVVCVDPTCLLEEGKEYPVISANQLCVWVRNTLDDECGNEKGSSYCHTRFVLYKKEIPKKTMKDYLGQNLEIGDSVFFVEQGYRSFKKGKILRFTPQFVVVEYICRITKKPDELKQMGHQLIKIDPKSC